MLPVTHDMIIQVSLDLYIMREAAIIFNGTKRMNTDWVAVVDEWACRFLVRREGALPSSVSPLE